VSEAARERLEQRLLVLAPTGKDAALACDLLGRAGFDCAACADLPQLARELERGAGAVLIAEEAVSAGGGGLLADAIGRQPPWSDLPVLLLAGGRGGDAAAAAATELLGNVTLLERPVRVATLASAVRTALRARSRQYQARAHFREREEADRRKDEFLATLAHELRNPLAPIRNAVQILRLSQGGAPAAAQLSEMMERQVGQMVRLVDDLLEVSRITRGKIELRRTRAALAAVIEAAIETSRPQIETSRHALGVELPPEPLYLDADATRLAQVFANLLNNAAKYTDPGGRITIEAAREGDEVAVCVRDTGMGIAPSALSRVFDMFVQADHASERMQGGLGIGLTLVRRLVEMHGGSVQARSEGPGKGSEFVVRLPLAAHPQGEAQGRAPAPPEPVKAPPRVLVVDDNRDAAESLGMLLQMLGADVTVTHDGVAALEALGERLPRAVFLDLGMPGMDGYEVARRIRGRPEGAGLTLIALTGWGQERDRRQTRAAGFDHHLIKPADLSALRALLESVSARQA
jgi:signal transduction histidine kinase/ActR/RegA family two-component response regulator